MPSHTVLNAVLENARRELLDLTTRNRLLSTARRDSRSSRLEVVDEISEQVFRTLVVDKKAMSFLPVADEEAADAADDEPGLLFQPGDQDLTGDDTAARHKDDKLQTRLTSDRLQKKLLKLYYDAQTYEQEQGINILYLALGFLKWYEDQNSKVERFAPLLLVPVLLERQSASSRFKIRYSDDDISTNLSLQERLKTDFQITLPGVPDVEELTPSGYFQAIASAVADQARWEILPNDIVLWFFSFSKFLMYRDLDPSSWPEDTRLDKHALVDGLLQTGFRGEPSISGDDISIDDLIPPADMIHVLDADSSQAITVEESRCGRNLVIQGPPGTGKSQTLANIISAAVKAGKTVLFVAEKMAALEVVRRRLNNIGLGDMCLELHSNKANKRTVLQDLEHTLELGQPTIENLQMLCEELKACRDRLNRHLQIIHTPTEPSGVSPYQAVGELVRLRAQGTRPPEFSLTDPLRWSRSEFQQKLGLLRDFVEQVALVGIPQEHPWRGVELDVVLPMDVDRIQAKVDTALGHLSRLSEVSSQLAALLRVSAPENAQQTSHLAQLAQRLDRAPPMDQRSLGSCVWRDQRQHLDAILHAGNEYIECHRQLDGVVTEAGWDMNVTMARQHLAAYGRSWFRIFRKSYREAQATLRGILVGEPADSLDDRLAVLDCLVRGQKAKEFLEGPVGQQIGREAFGSRWSGPMSDWSALWAIRKWENECVEAKIDPRFRQIYSSLDSQPNCKPLLQKIASDLKPLINEFRDLVTMLRLDLSAAFGVKNVVEVPFAELISRLRQWSQTPESLSRWVAYNVRRRRVDSEGMAELSAEIHAGSIAYGEALASCEMAYYETLIRVSFRNHPELSAFEGATHQRLIQKFRELDKLRIVLARHEVAYSHYARLPKTGSNVGEVGLIRREIQKKRRHLPIRRLIAHAGRAVQAIKPVFMMSPISVAQYLEPGAIDFDLLLIDEASQVQPVDALGAVARAKQIIVVGDRKQLPPTRFFSRMLGEDGQEDTENDQLQAGDMESILGLCCAQGMHERMLRWHYRSRHHSLIAVSNHEFYDDRLYVVPSPGEPGDGRGLTFHFVESGVFDRGGSATNRAEARAVAEAVMSHARTYPDKSLGVGTFSVSQRDAILDELELLRRDELSLEHFFVTATAEPFFVKNLENIQGDERDVIFISVGYGKDASGYMSMNFGPLSNDGGERRLNVLITRARDCCSVFSSIRAEDIDLMRAKARGAQALRTFLKYAETGLMDTGCPTGRDHDSEFERQVSKALAAHGYQTCPQVGVAGFFIDLAVVAPGNPGRYLLGIECDGANYHSSRSARDRDRLRSAVLEDRGWILHRIWSTDWFHRPDEELRKVLAAIEAAKIDWESRTDRDDTKQMDGSSHVKTSEIERCQCQGNGCETNSGYSSQPYVVASFRIKTSQDVSSVPRSELAEIITKIIQVEGPIHGDEIARRVTQLWGLQRTGRRIRDAVNQALATASRQSGAKHERGFYWLDREQAVTVRDRSAIESNTLRKPEMLPPAEIRRALTAIVDVHLGATREEVIVEAARLFGFKATSSQLREVIDREVKYLLDRESFEEKNGKLYATQAIRLQG